MTDKEEIIVLYTRRVSKEEYKAMYPPFDPSIEYDLVYIDGILKRVDRTND